GDLGIQQRARHVEPGVRVERLHHLLLHALLEALLHFLLDVLAHLGAQALHVARLHAEGLGELGIHVRQVRLRHVVHGDGEIGGLALHLLRVFLGESDGEGLRLAFRHALQRGLEIREHAVVAEDEGEVAAVEGLARDEPLEIDVDEIALLRRTVRILVLRALLAQRLDGGVDVAVLDRGNRLRDLGRGQVAHLDLGIDLEGGGVLDGLVLGLAIGPGGRDGLEARVARDAIVLVAHRFLERALHRLAQHLLADLEAVLALDHLQGHVPGAETLHPHGARERLQAGSDLGLDLRDRHRDGEMALERARIVLDCLLHEDFPTVLGCWRRRLPDRGGAVHHGENDLVRKEGLEPTSLSALEPKSSASTNSATFAVAELYLKKVPPAARAGSSPPDIIPKIQAVPTPPCRSNTTRTSLLRRSCCRGACARRSRPSTRSPAAPTTWPTKATRPRPNGSRDWTATSAHWTRSSAAKRRRSRPSHASPGQFANIACPCRCCVICCPHSARMW